MHNSDESALLHELLLLRRSPLCLSSKWCSSAPSPLQTLSNLPINPLESLSLVRTTDSKLAFLTCSLTEERFYLLSDLQERVKIKRHPATFRSLYTVWRYINPNRCKAITTRALFHLKSIVSAAIGLRIDRKASITPCESAQFVLFKEFYEWLFDLIDSATVSKQQKDYSGLVETAVNRLLNSQWYKKGVPEGVSLCGGRRTSFEVWMLPHFRTQSVSPVALPEREQTKKKPRQKSLNATSPVEARPETSLSLPFRIEVSVRRRAPSQSKAAVRTRPASQQRAYSLFVGSASTTLSRRDARSFLYKD